MTSVFQGCYKGVPKVLQECCEGVTRVSQKCYKSVTRGLQEGHSQEGYKSVTQVLFTRDFSGGAPIFLGFGSLSASPDTFEDIHFNKMERAGGKK